MRSLAGRTAAFGAVSVAAWLMGALTLAGADKDKGPAPPILRVPKLAQAPTIDGRLQPDEWRLAAAITAVGTYAAAGFTASVVPEIQQVVWYLAYDDQHLYLAMRSPHVKGTFPVARVKTNDASFPILFEDHVEIQICKYDRADAARPGRGFYKIMVNPRGYYSDEWYYNGTPGTELLWSMGGSVRCTVAEDHWDLELAASLKNLGVKSLDGQTWIIQLVRTDSCGGIYFAGWVPATWMEWHRFAAVTFDPTAPAFQFLKTGEIRQGQVDTHVVLEGTAAQARPVEVEVSLWAGDKKLFSQTRQAVVEKGKRQELVWQARDLPVADEGNWFRITASMAGEQPEAPSTVLYRAEVPVLKLTEAYYKQYIEPWIKGRPAPGEWEFQFAYSPYQSCIEASVDVDFLGMPERLLKASRFDLSLEDARGKSLYATQVRLEKMIGRTTAAVPELPEGQYRATAVLYAEDGKTELGRKACQFVRKKFPWEHNRIGLSDRVIPPYPPLETKDNHLRPWGRDYAIEPTGLPGDIRVSWQPHGGSPDQRLLAAPIRLVARIGGQEVLLTDAKMEVTAAKPHRTDLKARARLGGAVVETTAFMEYDGWYQVKLALSAPQPVAVEGLDLVCDLWPGADTIYAQRRDGRSGSKFGAVPPGQGVVWTSAELPVYDEGWGSFVPIVFLGSGDMGLWWLAESDAGWTRSDKTPCVQIERHPKHLTLRFHLLAEPVTLQEPRTIEFALLVTPVKPKPRHWRAFAWGWPEVHYAHDTCGYRYWGDSVDAYALASDDQYRQLRQFFMTPSKINPEYSWYERLSDLFKAGKPLVLYGSTWMTGMGMEEFDTFAGEWLGTNNLTFYPDNSFKDKTNYQNTVKWTTPRQLTATGTNFVQSQLDCFLWYHEKLVRLAGVSGCWWDNSSVGLVWDLVPGRGRVYRWNVFLRRQLTKRLATMGWDLGVPPLWLQNMHVDFSWCQVGWHIENDFYPAGIGQDLLGFLTLDEFRAMTALKGGLISQLHSIIPAGTENPFDAERIIRAGLGLCLVHDIGERGFAPWQPFVRRLRDRLLQAMEEHVHFFSGDPQNTQFVPYWRQRAARFSTPGVAASVYWSRDTGKSVIVFLNTNDEDVVIQDLQIDPAALGLPAVRRLTDAETGLSVGMEYDAARRQYVWGEYKPYHLMLRRHDVRLLVVE